MARETKVIVRDDLTGTEVEESEVETVTIVYAKKTYDLDLTDKSRNAFTRLLDFHDNSALYEVLKAAQPKASASHHATNGRAATIREWAKARDMKVNEKGRIPEDVQAEYDKWEKAEKEKSDKGKLHSSNEGSGGPA